MNDDPHPSLEQRIERLEQLYERLERRLSRAPENVVKPPSAPLAPPQPTILRPETPRGEPSRGPDAPPPPPAPPPISAGTSGSSRHLDQFGEQWLGKIGVGFVILALAFLFKLAFDRGWITPPLRLAFGLVVGVSMLVAGLRLEESRRRYSQVLMGGAVGVFYLVGFAGYQWYGLLPHGVALGFMVTVTVLAWALGVRQDQDTLAAIGAVGGLATPFLLYTEQGSVTGLIVYTSLILTGAGAVQTLRGWRILQGTLLVGGYAVLLVAATQGETADRWLVPAGAAVWWLVIAASPILRRWVLEIRGASGLGVSEPLRGADTLDVDGILARVLGVIGSLATVLFVALALDLGEIGGGRLILLIGALFAGAAIVGRPVRGLAAEIAAILIPIGTFFAFPDPAAFFALAVEAFVMHMLASRAAIPTLHLLGHGVVGFLGLWLWLGSWGRLNTSVVDPWALTTFGAIALVFGSALVFEDSSVRRVYQLGAYASLLLWLLAELALLTNGPALVSISWGALGVLVLVVGWQRGSRELQQTGLATLAVTAGKLVIFDLVLLDMVWRILVFLGFGAVFLGLSYLINRPSGSRKAAEA